ncbi:MAG TPA: PIN domain-containing protein [Verrucomicrobiae bacterium]|nr:PIN domain-containing protein [Verrucomicrobiae bacterium]
MTAEARLIDTNILVHAYTVSDTGKHATALSIIEKVWQGESAATTLQNLCEMFSVITRKVARPVSASSATAIVEGILTAPQWTVIDRTPRTVLKAAELVRLYRAPFWDALIAACMLENGIEIVLTENERDFKRIPGITVVNPFKRAVKR